MKAKAEDPKFRVPFARGMEGAQALIPAGWRVGFVKEEGGHKVAILLQADSVRLFLA